MLNEPNTALLDALKAALGPKGWCAPNDTYVTERRGLYRGQAAIILRPGSTAEVAEAVRLCAEARVGIVPWGGGTGLVGGQVKPEGTVPVVLALDRMRQVRAALPDENALIVEAGLPLQLVQQAAEQVDRLFPLSYASEGTASIGGGLAVNSGGLQAIRYGVARDLCLGLEVVTARGEVWDGLTTLRKDNTGYDLRDVFIGSEGTLGIITAAALKLYPRPRAKVTAFLTVRDPAAAIQIMNGLQDASDRGLAMCELMTRLGIDFVLTAHPDMRDPMPERAEWYMLIELWGAEEAPLTDALETVLGAALEEGRALDAVVATNEAQRTDFRALREAFSDAQKIGGGASIKHDVSLPIAAIPEFLERAGAVVTQIVPGARPCPFGHLGDGNIHYNVSQPVGGEAEAFLAHWDEMNERVHEIVMAMRGSISAEHGIGRLKRDAWARMGDSVKIRLQGEIKSALDPDGILNPGAVVS